jgi:hypothetical protein
LISGSMSILLLTHANQFFFTVMLFSKTVFY